MGRWINADYIKEVMKGDRLMQGNCEYELWKQEVDKKVDAMPSIEVMDVVTAYQQGWCDALDASIVALNDAKFQLANSDRKTEQTEPQVEEERAMKREDAIYWIKNLAVLSTEKDIPQIEEALSMAVEALQDEVWKDEHPERSE